MNENFNNMVWHQTELAIKQHTVEINSIDIKFLRVYDQVKELRLLGFNCEILNGMYQIRINDKLDIYPMNRRYHDLKLKIHGHYEVMVNFVIDYFHKGVIF